MRYQADQNGKLQVTIDVSDWAAGQSYVIAGRGVRTDITGATGVEIKTVTSDSAHSQNLTATSLTATGWGNYLSL